MFTDESGFCLRSPVDRGKVWRRDGKRYTECNFSPRVIFQGSSVNASYAPFNGENFTLMSPDFIFVLQMVAEKSGE